MTIKDVMEGVPTDVPYNSNSTVAATARLAGRRIPIHTTLYWGHKAYVLFPSWPGDNAAMYSLTLVVLVFAVAVLVEWLSFMDMVKLKTGKNEVVAGMLRTAIYGLRTGLSYTVMLAVMSFNGGVFVVAIVGHVIGFLVFGTQAIRRKKAGGSDPDKVSDL